ncbi:glycosyl hydrolase family 16 [Flavobacterium sp.]|uniref:glycosyl hydrolase family 16 n=1 Tax=Flavobacterium sp. TaxID=239 RepID=UPI00286E9E0C|nr:glycosyl hydrolase family 16 [Flavobacterium sp.]
MKTYSILKSNKTAFVLMGLLLAVGCQNDDADLQTAKASSTAEIFTDNPIGMGTNFYFPYGAGPDNPVGSKLNAWTVDSKVSYRGTSSMRFDVPNSNDVEGNYAGGIFRIDGAGRDLTSYDALTFWAKASQGVTIAEVGFGEDFYPNKYITTMRNVSLGTTWTKFIIPIPDASKLVLEKGMFRYAANTVDTNGKGYTFWIDELKFEKLGTIAHPQPKIMNGVDVVQPSYIDSKITVTGLTQTSNLASGQNQTVIVSPSYFKFLSSDIKIATVDEFGVVTLVGIGTATITASLNGVEAKGSLIINAASAFINAPIPLQPQANVISIFSDSYTGVTGFNPGFFAGPKTGSISNQVFSKNQHLNYQSIDYVGLAWDGTVNATGKTMLHLDIQLKNNAASNLKVELIDFGADNVDNGFGVNNGSAGGFNVSSQLVRDNWVSVNIPLNSFTLPTGGGGSGSPNRKNIGFVVFVSSNGASFLVDNIYFY